MSNHGSTKNKTNLPSTVDEYLSSLPDDEKKELHRTRRIISMTIPEIKERIAHKICVFALEKNLVGFAAQKRHLSVYMMSLKLAQNLKEDLRGFQVSGATIHFTPQEPLPKPVIQKILSND
jgi:uncharacterized protein YdhG (YjbR/CyaY superfamily)